MEVKIIGFGLALIFGCTTLVSAQTPTPSPKPSPTPTRPPLQSPIVVVGPAVTPTPTPPPSVTPTATPPHSQLPQVTPSLKPTPMVPADFTTIVKNRFSNVRVDFERICPISTSYVAKRLFAEYGAIFIISDIELPGRCIYPDAIGVSAYQSHIKTTGANVGGVSIELQAPAMAALLAARKEALENGLNISPRGGSIAAKRSFDDTVSLWYSRVYPALNYWTTKRRISVEQAQYIRSMPVEQQIEAVLKLEEQGIYFSKDFSKSVLYSVAAPGASQHLFMLALDVEQFGNSRVREILARHGWFQTVRSDLPHFTYLGVKENELPMLGLKPVFVGAQKFWVPNIREAQQFR